MLLLSLIGLWSCYNPVEWIIIFMNNWLDNIASNWNDTTSAAAQWPRRWPSSTLDTGVLIMQCAWVMHFNSDQTTSHCFQLSRLIVLFKWPLRDLPNWIVTVWPWFLGGQFCSHTIRSLLPTEQQDSRYPWSSCTTTICCVNDLLSISTWFRSASQSVCA